ncbi:MAG: DNA polymerase III subunit gamma/tau [candidate division WOR-3 bacterium]
MSGKILTLKYRPQTFDELWVQDHVRDTLKRAVIRNRLANAYLFTGPRGVGKTTTARILAKSLNCEKGPTVTPCNQCSICLDITGSRSLDVLEIDGASNRGIEQVRELRENIRYAPSACRFKVYIIDEVHMLTVQAFNALLKTLEEPPAHAKFIFATTHAHEVPVTIISRCQRFDFRKATVNEIRDRLAWLAAQEKIKISDAALVAVARRADGAIRDAESILDQLAAYKPEGIELDDVEELLGIVPAERFYDFAQLILAGDLAGLLRFVDKLFETGYDCLEFYSGLVSHFRTLLLLDIMGPTESLGLLPDETERLTKQARSLGRERLLTLLDTLTQAETSAKYTRMPRILLEVLALELAAGQNVPRAEVVADPPQPTASVGDKPPALDTAWAELRLRVNERKPLLASVLELATPLELNHEGLTIVLPTAHKAVEPRLQADQALLDRVLSEVLGRPAQLKIKHGQKPGPDPVLQKLTKHFGRVEEERPR